jgi:RHS repeat-associated protein
VVTYEEYFPFGSTSLQSVRSRTETPKRFRYTAKERDEETELAYHGARYYAPWLGRWTACDPLPMVDGPNAYVYAANNPIVRHDPTGAFTPREDVKNINEGLSRVQHYADNPEDKFGSPREYALARNRETGKLSIYSGGTNYIWPTRQYEMLAHSHHDQNAMPSGFDGDLGYVVRNKIRQHEIRAPAKYGISRAVLQRGWFGHRLTVRGYQAGREVVRQTYDISSHAGGGSAPPGTTPPLSDQRFSRDSLGSRISAGVRGTLGSVGTAAADAGSAAGGRLKQAGQALRSAPARAVGAAQSAARGVGAAVSSGARALASNPRAALSTTATAIGGTLARSFIPGAAEVLDSVAAVGSRATAVAAAEAAAPLVVAVAGAAAGYVVGDAVERYVTQETGSRTAGVVTGTAAGVLAGAAAGAAVGAAIGALGFGVGAVPGAAIGAAAGAVAGFIGAYW